ncbi:hypothetical protein CAPTEDRAFT_199752, partial [Capitella teleta]
MAVYSKTGLLSKGKPAHQFLFNLMISDAVSLISCQPFLMFNYVDAGIAYIQGKKNLCITSIIGMVMVWDSSRVGVLLLTAERLFAIACPLLHMYKMTRKIARWMIVVSWFGLFLKGFVVYFWNDYSPLIACKGTVVFKEAYVNYVNNALVYGSVAVIALLNFILVVKTLTAIRRVPKLSQKNDDTKDHSKKNLSEIRIFKFIFVLVAILVLTWGPFHVICHLIAAVRPLRPSREILIAYHLTRALTLVSTIVDPIIYFRQDPKCRAEIQSWFSSSSGSEEHKESSHRSKDTAVVRSGQ